MYENNYEDIMKAQNGDSLKMDKLVKDNMGLVYSITRRFKDRGYDLEDLNQIGTMGLIKAIKKFNTSYDVKLSTYSVPYILGEIKRFIRDDGSIKISRSIKEISAKISNLKEEYINKKNKELSIEEISEILNISQEDVKIAMEASTNNIVSSIYEPINDDKKLCIGDTIQSEKNEENEIISKLTIQKLLNELSIRDKKIIELRYFKGNTQSEVSKIMGISQVQISRIEKKLLIQMREKMIS